MDEQKASSRQLLKSTGIIGGSQILTIIIGIVKTKVVAVVLGPIGVGLVGLYQSITDIVRSLTGFGINFSAVREIAASGQGEPSVHGSRMIAIVRSWAILTGILGAIVSVSLCVPLSLFTFGSRSHALAIAVLSLAVFATSVSQAQVAVLQGVRRIRDMAVSSVLGAFSGFAVSIPLYAAFGTRGIVPSLILSAFAVMAVTWGFSRKIASPAQRLSLGESIRGGMAMAKLGFFIVITGFMGTLFNYFVKSFITHRANVESTGLFQAAWTISNVYIGIILNSMLADFFPRLSEVNDNDSASNRLLNDQAQIAIVLGSPLIVGILVFLPWMVKLLYSGKFLGAVPLIQWQMAGSVLVLLSWPLGVLFLAKGKGLFSILTDLVWYIVFIAILLVAWNKWGLEAIGIGSVAASVVKLAATWLVVRRLSGFRWNAKVLAAAAFFLTGATASFLSVRMLEGNFQLLVGAVVFMAVSGVSLKLLDGMVGLKTIWARIGLMGKK